METKSINFKAVRNTIANNIAKLSIADLRSLSDIVNEGFQQVDRIKKEGTQNEIGVLTIQERESLLSEFYFAVRKESENRLELLSGIKTV